MPSLQLILFKLLMTYVCASENSYKVETESMLGFRFNSLGHKCLLYCSDVMKDSIPHCRRWCLKVCKYRPDKCKHILKDRPKLKGSLYHIAESNDDAEHTYNVRHMNSPQYSGGYLSFAVKAALILSTVRRAFSMYGSINTLSSVFLTLSFVTICSVVSSQGDLKAGCSSEQGDAKFCKQVVKDRRHQRIEETEKLVIKKLLSKSTRKIDELCSELDNTCFTITDNIEKYGNMLLAFRSLRRKGPEGVLVLSQTRLQHRSPLNWENFNSKKWTVQKDYVCLTYARLMIAGAFLSGGLELNTTRQQDVLIIGLGGGVINNYLTQMENQVLNVTVVDIDPVMKTVAKKWFGFAESPLHRIIVDDGVRYIHDAAKRGEKYDVLLIDLCYNIPLPMMCPIREFLDDDLITSMKAITAGTGAVIVNIITKKGHSQQVQNEVFFKYSRRFPSCYFIIHSAKEKMLFCSAKENNSYLNNTDNRFYNRFVTVDDTLGFQLLPKN